MILFSVLVEKQSKQTSKQKTATQIVDNTTKQKSTTSATIYSSGIVANLNSRLHIYACSSTTES